MAFKACYPGFEKVSSSFMSRSSGLMLSGIRRRFRGSSSHARLLLFEHAHLVNRITPSGARQLVAHGLAVR